MKNKFPATGGSAYGRKILRHKERRTNLRLKSLKFLYFSFMFFALNIIPCALHNLFAEEITILYTGDTHAMLYLCSCPLHPEGGVARRAAAINKLRKQNPGTLLLDSGGFFAAGNKDEYSQNSQLDMKRTLVNLQAMKKMGYDAVNVSDEEFNFGREFLLSNGIEKTAIPFISCNFEWDKLRPYIIKEIQGIKIGIIGMNAVYPMQKAEGIKFINPGDTLNYIVQKLRRESADIIILLGYLPKGSEQEFLKTVSGIDVFIAGYSANDKEAFNKSGSTLLVRPAWQGRSLGKLTLNIKNKKIISHSVKLINLSVNMEEDPDIVKILPACFSDANCKKAGLINSCVNPGENNAQCSYVRPREIELLVILPKKCKACDTSLIIGELKNTFPGIAVSYLYYPSKKAEKYIKDFGLQSLPAYLLSKDVEKEERFSLLKQYVDLKGDFYKTKEIYSGVGYYLNREKIKGRIDAFVSLYDKDKYIEEWLNLLKEYNPAIHFLTKKDNKTGEFTSAHGMSEIEENLRCVCMQKYYPERFWEYITCRARNIQSSWWEDCAFRLDMNKIKNCAQSEEGGKLLEENTVLNKQIEVMFGPAFLLDNNQVFASQGAPTKEELKKLFKE